MAAGERLDVCVGSRLWYEGEAWTVVELHGTVAALESDGRFMRVHAPSLVGRAFPLGRSEDPRAGRRSDAVVLSSLSPAQRRAVEDEADVLGGLLTQDSQAPVDALLAAAASRLGVSVRTVRRRLDRYQSDGLAGLVDARLVQSTAGSATPQWDEVCREVLASFTSRSNPTRAYVVAQTNQVCAQTYPDAPVPKRTAAYARVKELDAGRYTFGVAKQRRSVAERPQGVLGRLQVDRPGQYVCLDTTRLDVFAMEPVTGGWLNCELTVAMDVYSRCILGLVLSPVSTDSHDVANVLYQTVSPQHWGPPEDLPGTSPGGAGSDAVLSGDTAGAVPDTIIIDHGSPFLSHHIDSVCRRLGISIQPAVPHKPTDKPWVERFFKTLREGLLERLPGYKGPDVASRGLKIEEQGFYYVDELEAIIREWVGVYHRTAHQGLHDPRLPKVDLSPAEMYARGLSASGVLSLPASEDVRMEFLEVEWRKIEHYGVQVDKRRYNGPCVNPYRGKKSPYGGVHKGRWPFLVDRHDIRTVFFQDPATQTWQRLEWDQAAGLDAPMSAHLADYLHTLSTREDRHVDPGTEVDKLLKRHAERATEGRREKNLARRIAAKPENIPAPVPETEHASADVVDLTTHLEARRSKPIHDDTDVFEQYVSMHPDELELEVLRDDDDW